MTHKLSSNPEAGSCAAEATSSVLFSRSPPPTTVQRRAIVRVQWISGERAASDFGLDDDDDSVFRAYSGGDSHMSVRPSGCVQMDAEADVHADHRVPDAA